MTLGIKHTISDDEVACRFAEQLRPYRIKHGLSQNDIVHKIGLKMITQGIISKLETYPVCVSWLKYNEVAKFMKWPLYVQGRKWSDWEKQQVLKKEGSRQGVIDFAAAETTPAEGLSLWLKTQEIKSLVDILAEIYSTTPASIIVCAVKEYVRARQELITSAKTRREQQAEQVRRHPQ